MLALGGGLAVLLILFGGLWIASLPIRDASLVDRFWGVAFVVLAAWYTGVVGPVSGAGPILLACVSIWGARLSLHITRRNWERDEDYRYRAMRERHGARFGVVSLFTVFLLQALLVWVIGMPLYAGLAGSRPRGGAVFLLGLGVALWVIGFLFETVGDAQLARHRADPARRGRVLDTGLWRYTRHPNYFGDAMVWWGLWLIAASAGGWWTVFSPVLMTVLLLRVSGVTLLERRLADTRPGYGEYMARTRAFLPGRPRSDDR